MKRFNAISEKVPRWFLYSCLLASVGFNLSWNPENKNLARLELGSGSFELAAKTPPTDWASVDQYEETLTPEEKQRLVRDKKSFDQRQQSTRTEAGDQSIPFGRFDLGEVNSEYVGIRMSYARNGADNSVALRLEGENVCTDCTGSHVTTLSNEDLSDISKLKTALTKFAIGKIKMKSAPERVEREESPGARVRDRSRPTVPKSVCRQSIKDGLMGCQLSEFQDAIARCENLPAKTKVEISNTCFKNAEIFFKNSLQKTLTKGLSSSRDSDIFSEAAGVRDDLLSSLPSEFDDEDRFGQTGRKDNIRAALTRITAQGVLARGQQIEQTVGAFCQNYMSIGCQSFAATQAKTLVQQEMQFTTGRDLLSSLRDSGNLDNFSLNQMYLASFQNPLLSIIRQNTNTKDGINWGTGILDPSNPLAGFANQIQQQNQNAQQQNQNGQQLNPNQQGPVVPGSIYDSRSQANRGTPAESNNIPGRSNVPTSTTNSGPGIGPVSNVPGRF